MVRLFCTLLLLLATAVFPPSFALAANITWIGGDGTWSDAAGNNANWNPLDEPDFDDTAIFNANNAVTSGPFDFDPSADSPVNIQVGPDGNLYYISITAGELRKYTYTSPGTSGYLSDLAWTSATNARVSPCSNAGNVGSRFG